MNEHAGAQLRVIKDVINALGAVDISARLFGGWGLDARIGRITREHGDIEFWLERVNAERSKAVLVGAGATALTTQRQRSPASSPGTASTSAPLFARAGSRPREQSGRYGP
jgi:hypothetical protein